MRILTFLTTMILSTFTFAKDLEVISPMKPGGTTSIMLDIIANHSPTELNLDIKYIDNCALVAQMAANDKEPRMFVADQDWWIETNACTPQVVPKDMVGVVIVGDVMMCARSEEPDYNKWFASKKGQVIRAAIHSDHDKTIELLDALGAKFGVTFDAIRYGSSSKARNAFRSNEVEYVFSSRDLSRDEKTQCYFTTRNEAFGTMQPLASVLPDHPWNNLSVTGFLYAKNLDSETESALVKLLADAQASQPYIDKMAKRGGTQYTIGQAETQEKMRRLQDALK